MLNNHFSSRTPCMLPRLLLLLMFSNSFCSTNFLFSHRLQFWVNSVLHRIILVCFQGSLTWDISLLLLIREVSVPGDTAMKWQSLSSSGSVSGTEPCRSEVDMWNKWEINLIVLNHWDLGLLCHCNLTLPVLTNTYILSITHVLSPLGGFLPEVSESLFSGHLQNVPTSLCQSQDKNTEIK